MTANIIKRKGDSKTKQMGFEAKCTLTFLLYYFNLYLFLNKCVYFMFIR